MPFGIAPPAPPASVRFIVAAWSYWNWSETVDPAPTVADCVGAVRSWSLTYPARLSVTVYAPIGSNAKNAQPSTDVVCDSDTPGPLIETDVFSCGTAAASRTITPMWPVAGS